MADLTVRAAYASVVEDEGVLFIGFAEGEDEDAPYALFRQPSAGGPVWFEVTDEGFGADDAIDSVTRTPRGLMVTLSPAHRAAYGFAATVEIRIGPETEDAGDALAALAAMMGPRFSG
jgi:hypothetical protein